jgi:hypothetical protein
MGKIVANFLIKTPGSIQTYGSFEMALKRDLIE